ncbi:hypothetical protein J2D73_05290 [Acetobacter sacchari]|uniref:KAP NTPase domain-containing protein n=1 Tax=Acetobacter sacchari TaxID=2661687 RepID=A0ABS3LTH3_9PROT|nr:P-loop NTPase fold protein [Acetobacter sacchari]MBO1359210.1 hypothetical protein [Acetobacter sacchari]
MKTWAGPNQDLVRTLDDYCYGKDAAPFALMLRGAWGSGKTWLVDRFFEEKKQNRNNDDTACFPLRVSLFGVASAAEIGDALYAELHPLLAGKPGQLGGFVVRSLLKTTLRIDFKDLVGGAGTVRSGEGMTLAGADLSRVGANGKPRRRIIVFDDLERAKMSATDVFAAVYPLVGNGENRVVFLANEEEITRGGDAEVDLYRRTKEKTICLTLDVKPDFKSALLGVSGRVRNRDFQAFLSALAQSLEVLVIKPGTSNLRLLSFFVQLGEDLFDAIDVKYRTEKYYSALSELFALVYIALEENRLHGAPFEIFSEIVRSPPQFLSNRQQSSEQQDVAAKTNREIIQRRLWGYNPKVLHTPLISLDDLESLVMRGVVRAESINKNLGLDGRFTKEAELPSWVRVWNYAQSSAQEVADAVAAFSIDFEKRTFVGLDMLHACSLYLTLHRVGQAGFEGIGAVDAVKSYITDVFAKKKLTEEDFKASSDNTTSIRFFAPFNRTFSEESNPKFKEIMEFYFSEQKAWIGRALNIQARSLEELFRSDIDAFMSRLFRLGDVAAVYENAPVLQYFDVTKFSRDIIDIPAHRRLYLMGCLKDRFDRTVHATNALHPEFAWFHKLSEALKVAVVQSDGSPLFKEGIYVSVLYLCSNVEKFPIKN